MRYLLTKVAGPGALVPTTFELHSGEQALLGNGDTNPSCDLKIHGDRTVSRSHVVAVARAERLELSDPGSFNGTWIGDRRITEGTLRDGETFRVGATELKFIIERPAPAPRPIAPLPRRVEEGFEAEPSRRPKSPAANATFFPFAPDERRPMPPILPDPIAPPPQHPIDTESSGFFPPSLDGPRGFESPRRREPVPNNSPSPPPPIEDDFPPALAAIPTRASATNRDARPRETDVPPREVDTTEFVPSVASSTPGRAGERCWQVADRCRQANGLHRYDGVFDVDDDDSPRPSTLLADLFPDSACIAIVHLGKIGLQAMAVPNDDLPPSPFLDCPPLFDWIGDAETARSYGPILCDRKVLNEILPWIDSGWGQDGLMLFEVTSVEEAFAHLRKLLHDPPIRKRNAGLFGYCWPSVLTPFLTEQTEEVVDRIFGSPIRSVLMELPDLPTGWQIYSRRALPPLGTPATVG
ncbi:MAG TPA: hypothetical protein DCQ98_09280 [Planctomycetaceae bacterium]|nr:hypothetical protein [Planctomycetaceae bacterium]HRF00586.1 FHA domain-containing protein [Pirellulaceae bacterium]